MSILEAIFLGIVQGLTEFLPISSSGHLSLVPFILGLDQPSLTFDVAVHVGTLAAVIAVFRREVVALISSIVHWSEGSEGNMYLVKLLALSAVPAAIVGAVFESVFDDVAQRPVLVAILLGLTGYFLLSTETKAEQREEEPRGGDDLAVSDAVGMGLAQAVSILPGISRSGATIATGMRLGLGRAVATRFSFLMAIPIIFGAMLVKLPDLFSQGLEGDAPVFIVGALASALAGRWAIEWFLVQVQRRSLRSFGVYLLLAMTAGLITGLARG